VQVKSLSGVTAIAAHSAHSMALRTVAPPFDSIVQAWGWNADGQLGDGTTMARPFPVQVANLSEVKAIAVGSLHSLAVGAPRAYLNVRDILVHPFTGRKRLFNLRIDGMVVNPAGEPGQSHGR
jgi:hypothetical protein